MTRTQASDFLKTLGIEEPTDEQITNYLNSVNGAVKSEKDRADKLKADASLVDDLKAQLEALNNQNLSDVEKANKATEQANTEIAKLQKQIKEMQTKTKLAELGITGEIADAFFGEDGSLNFDVLGQIISDREKSAMSLKEKELAFIEQIALTSLMKTKDLLMFIGKKALKLQLIQSILLFFHQIETILLLILCTQSVTTTLL